MSNPGPNHGGTDGPSAIVRAGESSEIPPPIEKIPVLFIIGLMPYIIIKSRFKKNLERFIERAMEGRVDVSGGGVFGGGGVEWVDVREVGGVSGEGVSLGEVKEVLGEVEVVGVGEDGSLRRRRF